MSDFILALSWSPAVRPHTLSAHQNGTSPGSSPSPPCRRGPPPWAEAASRLGRSSALMGGTTRSSLGWERQPPTGKPTASLVPRRGFRREGEGEGEGETLAAPVLSQPRPFASRSGSRPARQKGTELTWGSDRVLWRPSRAFRAVSVWVVTNPAYSRTASTAASTDLDMPARASLARARLAVFISIGSVVHPMPLPAPLETIASAIWRIRPLKSATPSDTSLCVQRERLSGCRLTHENGDWW